MKDNIKVDCKETCFENTVWIQVAEDSVEFWAGVNTAMNFRLSEKEGNFLATCETISFMDLVMIENAAEGG
jgi:hypothetical protein